MSPAGPALSITLGSLRDYWHTWLPGLLAAIALAVLAVLAAAGSTGVRRIAPAGMFGIAALGMGVLGATALWLADAASEGDGVTVFDRPIWQAFIDLRSPGLTPVVRAITEIGSTVGMTILALIVAGLLWWRGRRGDAVMTVVAIAGAGCLVFVTKRVVGRARPPEEFRLAEENALSFPSGHSLVSFVALVMVAIVAWPVVRSLWARVLLIAGVTLAIVAIGASRLYLGVHWTTDVLGGWVTGALWLLTVVTVRRLWRSYRDNEETGHPSHTEPGVTDLDPSAHHGAIQD